MELVEKKWIIPNEEQVRRNYNLGHKYDVIGKIKNIMDGTLDIYSVDEISQLLDEIVTKDGVSLEKYLESHNPVVLRNIYDYINK